MTYDQIIQNRAMSWRNMRDLVKLFQNAINDLNHYLLDTVAEIDICDNYERAPPS